METSFIVNLLEIASTDENIDDFVNFCDAVHEKTGCTQERCNSGSLVKERDWFSEDPKSISFRETVHYLFSVEKKDILFFLLALLVFILNNYDT